MPDGKFKVQISEETNRNIRKDMSIFKIEKNGKKNINSFINLLFDEYRRNPMTTAWADWEYEPPAKKNVSIVFALHTDNYRYYMNELEERLKQDKRESIFFRDLLDGYFLKSQYVREKIICQRVYEQLLSAIDRRYMLKLHLIQGRTFLFSPQAIVTPDEEKHNYLVGVDERGEYQSIKLSSVVYTSEQGMSATISSQHKTQIEFAIKTKDPFAFDVIQVVVRLTSNGKKMYRDIHYNRPHPFLVMGDEDVVTIKTSSYRAALYFLRFGKDAEILAPPTLRQIFVDFYKEASEVYE